MAITTTCLKFLISSADQQKVSFERTLTLGHLENMVDKELIDIWPRMNAKVFDAALVNWKDKFADSIFTALGASEVYSLDKSGYEDSSLVCDLNEPLPSNLNSTFTTVLDGGTLEHVFNFPQAIKSCLQLIKLNGHFIGFTPMNNLMGHGFYQFSPELYYRIFSEENGFQLQRFSLIAADFFSDTDYCYDVPDPAMLKERIILKNCQITVGMIIAKKIRDVTPFIIPPSQSDYANTWKKSPAPCIKEPKSTSLLRKIYKKLVAGEKRKVIRNIYLSFFRRGNSEENLERINRIHFIKNNI